MIKIRVRNFQSIQDAEVKVDGLVVLTGPNNAGKSALFRALKGVFTNARSTQSFVRHGSTHADVTVELRDGTTVRWEKGEKTNRYTLNGKVLDKVGSGCPDPVALASRVFPVKIGDQQLWPQVAQQFSGQVFLINQSGAVIAEAISDTDKVSRLNSCLRDAEHDKRQTVQSILSMETEKVSLSKTLESYANLDQLRSSVGSLLSLRDTIDKVERGVARYQDLRERRDAARAIRDRYLRARDLTAPDLTELIGVVGHVESLGSLREQVQRVQDQIRTLSPVKHIVPPSLSDGLTDAESQLAHLRSIRDRYATLRGLLSRPKPPLLADLDSDKIRKIDQTIDLLRSAQHKSQTLESEVRTLRGKIVELQGNLSNLDAEIEQQSRNRCPTCGALRCESSGGPTYI